MKQKHYHMIAVLFALLLPCTSWADDLKNGDVFVVDGISYTYWHDYASVSSGENQKPAIDPATTGSISIPAEVTAPNGILCRVEIGSYAFYKCTGLTSVQLPSTIEGIGTCSFYGCTGLTSIDIPSSVTTIWDKAFYGCTGLTSINLPSSLTDIYESAFKDCCKLMTFTIPQSVTHVGTNCFDGTAWYESQADGYVYKDGILLDLKNPASVDECNVIEGTRVIADDDVSDYDCTSITLPNTVTHIGSGFMCNTNITSLIIPKSVVSIRKHWYWGASFRENRKLESIVVESGNSHYDSRNNCNAIIHTETNTLEVGCKNTIIPDGIEIVEGTAFSGLDIEYIEIPHSVMRLSGSFFCSKLTTVKIGKNVRGQLLFDNCSRLTEVYSYIKDPDLYVPDSRYARFNQATFTNGTLYVPTGTKAKYEALDGWKNFANIVERDDLVTPLEVGERFTTDGWSYTVTSIDPLEAVVGGNLAVDNTTAQTLTSVVIPESVVGSDGKTYSVTGLSDGAFSNCKNLTEIHSKLRQPRPGSNSFWSTVYNNATLYVPVGSMAFYTANYPWKNFKNIVVEGENLDKSLAKGEVFTIDDVNYRVTAPFEVEVGNNSTDVGKAHGIAPNRTGTLEIKATLTGPDGNEYAVTAIQARAFINCSGLTAVSLPSSIASIGQNAFSGCSSLTSFTLPKSVVSMQNNPFSRCASLKSIRVEDGNPVYDSRNNCNAIIQRSNYGDVLVAGFLSTTIPEGITKFGTYAFSGVTGLTSFTFPEGTEQMPTGMFYGCTDLVSVSLPSTLKTIESYAFEDCSSLKSINIPESVTYLNSYVFEDCSSLTSITIPKNVNRIGYSLFWGCTNLETIVVEEGNTTFDSRDNCNAIIQTEINSLVAGCKKTLIPSTVTTIGREAFRNQKSLTSITIPGSVDSIAYYAFYYCTSLVEIVSEIKVPFDIPDNVFSGISKEATLYVPAGTKNAYLAKTGWTKYFAQIVEEVVLEPIEGETKVTTEGLAEEDLTDNVVDDIYYNVGDDGYDPTDGSIVISETTNMGQIGNAAPGSDDVKDNFTGIILRVAAGKGTIKVNVKTTGNAQLVVQVGNGTPMIASRTEQGDVVVGYDVAEDTYVYIYAIIGSSNSRGLRAAGADEVRIYGISVLPGADGIGTITAQQATTHHYYTLDGRRMEGRPTRSGLYIVDGRKVIVK